MLSHRNCDGPYFPSCAPTQLCCIFTIKCRTKFLILDDVAKCRTEMRQKKTKTENTKYTVKLKFSEGLKTMHRLVSKTHSYSPNVLKAKSGYFGALYSSSEIPSTHISKLSSNISNLDTLTTSSSEDF